jgi:hypothetical protein
MKLTDKKGMSKWAYFQCLYENNDTPEMRDLITDPYWAFCYCRWIKDIEEMRIKITDSRYAYWYCRWIKDRPEVRRYIK